MSRTLCLVMIVCVLGQTFCVPAGSRPKKNKNPLKSASDNEVSGENAGNADDLEQIEAKPIATSTSKYDWSGDDDDDDDFGESMNTASSTGGGGGGSNILSLLNLATALFPSSSGANRLLLNMLRQYLRNQQPFLGNQLFLRRNDTASNIIDIDYVKDLTLPFQRQEIEEHDSDESDDHDDDDDDHSSEENDAAEESLETNNSENNKSSKQETTSNGDDDNNSDYSDEPPGGGDGQGGGILGLLAGLSGGEDGESDLGSLLAAVSGIVVSLSGDGFDLNSLIGSALGLFVGLLSEGEENPGAVIASYLLTSLETITGGGAQNNGAFFGTFLSKLVKGISAAGEESGSESGSDENEGNGTKMSDSAGFFVSVLMSLLGDMSKGSSGGSSHPSR